MSRVMFVDETTAGARADAWALEILEDRLPLRELIRRRIYQEVAEYHARQPDVFRGLVQPTATERALNGDKPRHRIDWEKQYEQAVRMFQSNGFVVLVGDRQVTELDDVVNLATDTEVTFLQLVPLVGG